MSAFVSGTIYLRNGQQILFTRVRESEIIELAIDRNAQEEVTVELYEYDDAGRDAEGVLYINPRDVSAIKVNLSSR